MFFIKEFFKEIKGFEGRYAVSNLGNVMSLNYLKTGQCKILKPIHHHTGYLYVHLGKDATRSIHTLVADAFIDNPDGLSVVNHIDGNKHNNRAENLEWTTSHENILHAVQTGLRNPHKNNIPRGGANIHSKRVIQYTKSGDLVKSWDCISEAARCIGCNPCMIINNASGRTLSCHGYVWKYADE